MMAAVPGSAWGSSGVVDGSKTGARHGIGTGRAWGVRNALAALVAIGAVLAGTASADASGFTKTWDGGGGDAQWSNPLNWTPDGVPGIGDTVLIDVPASTITVLFSSGTSNIVSLTCEENLAVTCGSLSIGGTATIAGSVTLSSGTLTLNGVSSIGGTLGQSGSGGLAGTGTVEVAGLLSWTGGEQSGAGVTNANGGVAISGSGTKTPMGGRTLRMFGSCTWTGSGNIQVNIGSVLEAMPGSATGSFTLSGVPTGTNPIRCLRPSCRWIVPCPKRQREPGEGRDRPSDNGNCTFGAARGEPIRGCRS